MHGRRNRSGRPGGCRTNNLTNMNCYVHIIILSTFVNEKWIKNTSRKNAYTACGLLVLRKVSKFDGTICQILRLKCTKFDFHWGSATYLTGELTALPRTPSCIKGAYLRGYSGRRGGKGEEKVKGRGARIRGRGEGRELKGEGKWFAGPMSMYFLRACYSHSYLGLQFLQLNL